MIGGAALTAGVAAVAIALLGNSNLTSLLVSVFVYGGTMLVLYALCVAHANDLLPQAQFLDAARGFNFLYGVGAAIAPVAIGALMTRFGAASLYFASALLMGGLGGLALFRALFAKVVPVGEREEFVAVATPSPECLEMYPHTPVEQTGNTVR